jgi:chemotaxis protein methyltransferase CheR
MLSAPDFEYLTRLLLDNAAIRINNSQEYLVRSRLEPLAKASGLSSLTALVEELRKQPYGELHRRVVEAMTTNETSFFRDVHPFEAIKVAAIPEILRRKTDRVFRVWSAACSTGQEPYSLSMLLSEMPALKEFRIQILATDLSRPIIEKAEQGVYTALEIGRGLPARSLAQHFERQGTSFRVKPTLRAMIEWRQMNLAGKWHSMIPFDLILMRNVLIYFSPTTTESILRNARNVLQPHGALFLGTTENMLGLNTGLESVTHGKTIYYKPKAGRP